MMMLVFGLPVVLAPQGRSAASDGAAHGATISNAARSIAHYFIPATSSPKAPDALGFVQRWLLLEPMNKPNRSNSVFTGSYIRNAFSTDCFPLQFPVVPRDGDSVKVADQELTWHALDATNFNVTLFVTIAGTDRALAATTDGEVITVPTFTGAPGQLWRIDQLADGTCRIMPTIVPESEDPLILTAIGNSTPTLARFDPKKRQLTLDLQSAVCFCDV
jgi:hypothetical protein